MPRPTTQAKNRERIKREASIQRSIEKFEGKMALMAEWKESGQNNKYMQDLQKQVTRLRAQLRVKNVPLHKYDLVTEQD